ncbi:hypothetical protein EG68_04307 [Paragonimus skrjabini miyazakii]|uniref:Uncharacterized protein n=1 Tax=Paragonimus skrjabini miyazakii TaxID=59628 RepID=A0A8S9Z8J2_9TREM|nr:hypothetical protein EG68_04307 [Paragonimus skrjabini miyazakii]
MDQSLEASHSSGQILKTDLLKDKPSVIYELAVRRAYSPQWDSCQFEASYQGEWELIKPRQSVSNEQMAYTALQLTIAGKHIHIRSLESPDQQEVSFQCVRKASETIGDCRPRDVCLELYQSGMKRSLEDRNTNSMQYRLCKQPSHHLNMDILN